MKHREFEQKVMELLIAGDEEPFITIRKQYEKSEITKREFTGRGFFTDFQVPDELVVNEMHGELMDVYAQFEDTQYGYLFILFVNHGKIDGLEGVTFYDDWDYNYDEAKLAYDNEAGRIIEIEGYET